MTDTEARLRAFEEWCYPEGEAPKTMVFNVSPRNALEIWQAALDSVVVEMPPVLYKESDGFPVYDAEEMQKAIHAAGVRIK